MRYNFNVDLYTLRGKPILPRELGIPDTDDQMVPATAGEAVVQALIGAVEIERRDPSGRPIPKQLEEKEKWERFRLAERLQHALDEESEIELDAEEITLIKHMAGVAYPPEVMGPVWRVFDAPIPVFEEGEG